MSTCRGDGHHDPLGCPGLLVQLVDGGPGGGRDEQPGEAGEAERGGGGHLCLTVAAAAPVRLRSVALQRQRAPRTSQRAVQQYTGTQNQFQPNLSSSYTHCLSIFIIAIFGALHASQLSNLILYVFLCNVKLFQCSCDIHCF